MHTALLDARVNWILKTTNLVHCSLPLPQLLSSASVSSTHTSLTGGLSKCHSPGPISATATLIPGALPETLGPEHLSCPHPQALSLASSLLAQSLSISYWTMSDTPPESILYHPSLHILISLSIWGLWKDLPKHKSEG